MSALDALYIFDRYAPTPTLILQHEWRSRTPTSPHALFAAYTEHPAPAPSLLYVPTTSPPTLLFNIVHSNLVLLCPTISEIEPLLVLEFLHRVVDVLEDYLGAPVVGSKIEANYEIVAQLLNEMADDGFPFTTEPNALRDLVLPPSLMGKLLGSVTGLPSTSLHGLTPQMPAQLSTIPWRRANVKHTSNELYVDLLETLVCTLAPSGRPLTARATGTIAFTSKLSGVPDILLTLSPPSTHKTTLSANPRSFLRFPVFHPCVRLKHYQAHPGELSFVPPDGKFVLASYEVDLLGAQPFAAKSPPALTLPVSVEMNTALGPDASEFEIRVFVSAQNLPVSNAAALSNNSAFGSRRSASPALAGGGANAPVVENVEIRVPLPPAVKTLVATRVSKGEFTHENGEIVWRIPSAGGSNSTATFRTGIQVRQEEDDDDDDEDEDAEGDEEEERERKRREEEREARRVRRLREGMPRSALVAWQVRGWLCSGVKVDSVRIVGGKGMGEGVKPYKGVKYVTRSEGVEVRC